VQARCVVTHIFQRPNNKHMCIRKKPNKGFATVASLRALDPESTDDLDKLPSTMTFLQKKKMLSRLVSSLLVEPTTTADSGSGMLTARAAGADGDALSSSPLRR
jgi:hypothetical protein